MPTSDTETIFNDLASSWHSSSPEKSTQALINASLEYFTPDFSIPDREIDHRAASDLVMTGIALGDMSGMPYESCDAHYVVKSTDPELYKHLPFLQVWSKPTDDTVMAAAISSAAKEIKRNQEKIDPGYPSKLSFLKRLFSKSPKNPLADQISLYSQAMKSAAKQWPDAGYGSHFYRWAVDDVDDDDFKSYGNGAAMRSGAIGAVFDEPSDVITQAALSALPTHSDPEGIKSAVVTAMAVFMGIHGVDKDKILEYMSMFWKDPELRISPEWNIEKIENNPEIFTLSLKAEITMPEVIIDLRDSESYESCIRNVMRYECDADTIGSISGGIAAAIYGNTDVKDVDVDAEIKKRIPDELRRLMYKI